MLDIGMTGSSGPLSAQSSPLNQLRDKADKKDFGEMVGNAVSSVNSDIAKADGMSKSMAAGQDVGIAETMIAINKAGISFRMMLQVRNKALSAYEEIMRMQV